MGGREKEKEREREREREKERRRRFSYMYNVQVQYNSQDYPHYTRFYNPNPQGSSRGPVGGAQPPKLNGFTKSTQVHMFGPTLSTARDVRQLNPYCARSIIKRDPYFVDHTHSAKVHAHM